jgi:hypothetical protein
MNGEPKNQPSDPNTWPVVECEPADVFLGAFGHDCTPGLTGEQRAWPVLECESADILVEGEKSTPPSKPTSPRS